MLFKNSRLVQICSLIYPLQSFTIEIKHKLICSALIIVFYYIGLYILYLYLLFRLELTMCVS